MGEDYYATLKVGNGASSDDIKKAYRRLAMKWHPDKNPNNRKEAEANFKRISEAYEVLSDSEKRAIYDQYGEEGLKGQFAPPSPTSSGFSNGNGPNGFRFNPKNAEDIFAEFFGSTAFPNMGSTGSRPGGSLFNGRPYGFSQGNSAYPSYRDALHDRGGSSAGPHKDPPIESKLKCTLEELYNGAVRKMKISRDVLNGSGKTVTIQEVLSVEIKPGWKKGTKITFPEKGNEQLGVVAADLVFVIDERPHDLFKREGNDLLLVQKIGLVEALTGFSITIPTLSGKQLNLTFNDIIYPGYEKIIPKEGMPIAKEHGRKGNFRIKFEIRFPSKLSPEQKAGIKRILGGHA